MKSEQRAEVRSLVLPLSIKVFIYFFIHTQHYIWSKAQCNLFGSESLPGVSFCIPGPPVGTEMIHLGAGRSCLLTNS